jgi:hypothetical protein
MNERRERGGQTKRDDLEEAFLGGLANNGRYCNLRCDCFARILETSMGNILINAVAM